MTAVVRVAAVAGLVTVQDLGRPGLARQGIPAGGALVLELLVRANLGARNPPGAAALEVFGALTLVSDAPLLVADDDGTAREVAPGDAWSVTSRGHRVRYVAARGGLAVPVVLGGRGTHLAAGFGGHEGRALRRGDALAIADASPFDAPMPGRPSVGAAIEVIPGPDLDRLPAGTLQLLLASAFSVDVSSDRVGVRLSGGPDALRRLPDDTGVSGPMVLGAIQLPPGGDPLVLGPDHPTMGGYPVVATVTRASQGALFATPPHAAVRFVARTSPWASRVSTSD